MDTRYLDSHDTACGRLQAAKYCALVTLLSKLILALLFAAVFVVIRYLS